MFTINDNYYDYKQHSHKVRGGKYKSYVAEQGAQG